MFPGRSRVQMASQWHVLLRPNMVSEQEEAAENLIGLLAMLLALSIALVAGTTLAIQRALRPISQILAILTQMGRRNYAARIAPSPIRAKSARWSKPSINLPNRSQSLKHPARC